MKVYIRSNYRVKTETKSNYTTTKKYDSRVTSYVKFEKIKKCIDDTIDILCREYEYNILHNQIRWHRLKNKQYTIDGKEYVNPVDIHVKGIPKNNDVIILVEYNHDNNEIILLDIGSHKYFGLD